MATINYTVQIVAVAPNLLAGELDGLHLWAGANFDSVFWAVDCNGPDGHAVLVLFSHVDNCCRIAMLRDGRRQ